MAAPLLSKTLARLNSTRCLAIRSRPILIDDVSPVAEIPAKIIAYQRRLGTIEIAIEAEKRPEELERFNQAMVGREQRMIDLKREVNDLCTKTRSRASLQDRT